MGPQVAFVFFVDFVRLKLLNIPLLVLQHCLPSLKAKGYDEGHASIDSKKKFPYEPKST